MAGGQCSGKSSVLTKITSGQISPRIVNVDKFVELFVGTSGQNIYDTPLYDKAKLLTKEQLFNYTNGLLPLIIDGTGADLGDVIKRKDILESIGYDTGMVMVSISKETALRRLAVRNAQGGRQVAIESFHKRHDAIERIKPQYRSMFDFYIDINNDDGMLTDDVVMKAFKQSLRFFTSPISNSIGSTIYQKMRSQGYKYLVPEIFSEQQLKSKLQGFM
jgi:predicted ABC-type ATPase